jgi:hypothetical protein
MKWIRRIGLACLGLVLSAPGYACTVDNYESSRTIAAISTVIFEGVAVGTPLDDPRSALAWAELGAEGRRDLGAQSYFRVTRIWKGRPGHIALVRQPAIASLIVPSPELRMDVELGVPYAAMLGLFPCSYYSGIYSFKTGNRYLVFARQDENGELQALVHAGSIQQRTFDSYADISTYEELFQRMIERGAASRYPARPVPHCPANNSHSRHHYTPASTRLHRLTNLR